MPNLNYKEELSGFTLNAGETRTISSPGELKGVVTVNTGGKLFIRDIALTFAADSQIIVDGGTVELSGVTFTANGSLGPLLIISEKTPVFTATSCVFDGSGKAQLIKTAAAKTDLTDCTFSNGFVRGTPVKKATSNTSFVFQFAKAMNSSVNDIEPAGAAIESYGALHTTNCNFVNNIAETAAGAINSYGRVQISNCVFKDCQSKGIGGALVARDIYVLTLCTFESCTAVGNGGAVFLLGGTHTDSSLEQCSFNKCTTSESGGGCRVENRYYKVNNNVFTDCSAAQIGGGVSALGADQCNSMLNMNTFTNCIAQKGGAIARQQTSIAQSYSPKLNNNHYVSCKPDNDICILI
ncbi:hypothetical protein HXX01_05365 [Candidatus Nomurabacteria bacterium]|nr:hypothetical protein [Candidatus Nomurabacteria bacterium]